MSKIRAKIRMLEQGAAAKKDGSAQPAATPAAEGKKRKATGTRGAAKKQKIKEEANNSEDELEGI